MIFALSSPESAVYQRGLTIFFAEAPPTNKPQRLFRPFFFSNTLSHTSGLDTGYLAVGTSAGRER